MKYQTAIFFTKKGNLLPWLYSKGCNISEQAEEFYGKEREIQLILLIRRDNGKIYCCIKCPVNPLPIKGEFEVPCVRAITSFLLRDGWSQKQTVYAGIFN